jgi:hypothetical protein
MKTQSRIRLVVGVVFPLVLFISLVSLSLAREEWTTAALSPEGENTFDFTNNETEDAYDLHIKWSHAVTVKESEPFKKVDGSTTSSTDLSNGVVKKGGGKASVKVSWDGSDPKVKEWWWTKQNGNRLGEVKKGNPTTASVPLRPSSIIRDGLRVVTFDNAEGRVIVNLPDDMMAGDTISGTVIAEPKGNTEEERNRNRGVLNSYVIQIQDQNFPVKGATIGPMVVRRMQMPTEPGMPPTDNSFFDVFFQVSLDGVSRLGSARIPVPSSGAVITPDPNQSFLIPPLGQTGRPLVIPGPFDGNSSNTTLRRAVQDFEKNTENVSGGFGLIAESPRKAIFQSPTNVSGPMEITLNEGSTQTKGNFRNLGVNLTAPKTSLMKGESTELRVEINGLQGITQPVPLHLVKGGVVTMQGGDVQSMTIKPAEVQSNGTFTTTRTITGVQTGVWNATATVVVFDTCLQDDNSGDLVVYSSVTGDFIFCQGRRNLAGANPTSLNTLNFGGTDFTGGVRVAAGDVNDSGGSGTGLVSIGPGASMYRNGAVTVADFNYKVGSIHVQIDPFHHTGNATVQTTQPKQTFTITDRDTRNNTCACK